MSQFGNFLKDVANAIQIEAPYTLRNWVTQEEYFDLLTTATIEALNQQTRKQIEAGGSYEELRFLLDRLLLRRYLLSSRFEAFLNFTNATQIPVPSPLKDLLDNWKVEQPPYQSQIQFIKGLVDLQCNDNLFGDIIKDIRVRFLEHIPFVNLAVTSQHSGASQSLMRHAFTFIVASDKDRKVSNTSDVFLSALTIDSRFKQAVEEIQNAMSLKNRDGIRYWYQLDLFQKLVRNHEIRLDSPSAGAAIGWLIFLIERDISLGTPQILSLWGVYDAYRNRFRPVDGLKEKIGACLEDGIRIVVVPEATLEHQIETGTSFKAYAQQQKIHLIAFPADLPISEVYPFILEKCKELGIIANDNIHHDAQTHDNPVSAPGLAFRAGFQMGQILSQLAISHVVSESTDTDIEESLDLLETLTDRLDFPKFLDVKIHDFIENIRSKSLSDDRIFEQAQRLADQVLRYLSIQ